MQFQETVELSDTSHKLPHVGILRWIGAPRGGDQQSEHQDRHHRNQSNHELSGPSQVMLLKPLR
jgi:hypothetical protein